MTELEKMSAAELVETFFELKSKMAEIEAAHAARIGDYKEAINEVTQLLLGELQEQGLTSVKVDGIGTFGISQKTVFKTDNKLALRDYAISNDELDLLTVTLNSAGVKEYIERTGGLPEHVTQVTFSEPYNRAARRS